MMVRSKRIWAAAAILLCTGLVLALSPTALKVQAKRTATPTLANASVASPSLQKASDKAINGAAAKAKAVVAQKQPVAVNDAAVAAKLAAADQAEAEKLAAEQAIVDAKKAADAQARLEAEQAAQAAAPTRVEETKQLDLSRKAEVGLEREPEPVPEPVALSVAGFEPSLDEGFGSDEPVVAMDRAACVGDVATGTGSGTTSSYPLSSYWYYTRSMSLIKRTELTCTPYKITQIAIQITTAQTNAALTNVEIRMKKTAATSTGTTWDGTGTLVWSASSLSMTPVGWKVFDITDFVWDSDNLLITWQAQGPSTTGYPYYEYSSPGFPTGSYPEAYGNSDSSFPTSLSSSTTRTLYKLTFEAPPALGACCVGYTCTPNMSLADCTTAGGIYRGDGSVCSPSPCQAACCVSTACYNYSPEECTTAAGIFHAGVMCAPGGTFYCPPWNDNCTAVTPVVLTPGTPTVFTGDTRGATNDCSSFAGGQVWHAFTVPSTASLFDVVLDYCPTTPAFGNAWLNLALGCPCSSVTAAGAYNTTSCGSGNSNLTIKWSALAPGTYYYPVLMDPSLAFGPYTLDVVCYPGYCVSGATSTADETLKNVTFGTIINTTTNCDTYDNFTSLSTTVQAGFTYPFSVIIGDCEGSGCYSKRLAIFIDLDDNYDFAGAGERVYNSGQLGNTPCPDFPVSGNITIPATATLGPTRMRVVVVETSSADPAACGTYSWGATEDYTINVVAPPPIGACCDTDGNCTLVYGVNCLSPSVYKGDGTVCTPNPCVGACCYPDGSCTLTLAANCTGSYHGDGTVCGPNPCPQPGACCPLTGICYMSNVIAPSDCVAGDTYKGDGTVCTPTNPCPQPGACCRLDGTCYMSNVIAPGDCVAGDLYKGDGTVCTPNPCPQPGACCFYDGTCLDLPDWACAAASGTFKGAGTTCANTLCPVILFNFPMDTDPGWTCEGQWAYGQPQGLLGDPASGHTGLYVYGYNLAGQYAASIPAYNLTTPAFNFTGYMNIELRFWRWLGVESNSYDHARILVSTTGAEEAWVEIWANPSTSIIETAWSFQTYTLPAQFNNQPAVYIRWVMGLTDTSVQYCGWNIDDVQIWGAAIPPVGACCSGATCTILTAYDCSQIPGASYKGNGTVCGPNPCIGACCYLNGSCTLGLAADCTANYLGDGTVCSPNPCPQPGMNCGNPFLVSLTPGFGTLALANHTTCGMGYDYADTCLGYYDSGEDTLYQITLTSEMCLTITLDPQGTTYPGFALANTCPPGLTGCIIVKTESGSTPMSSLPTALAAGVYYLMVDTWASPNCIPAYNLTFAECPQGACCHGSTCTQTYSATCATTGGIYAGDNVPCSPNPCLTGACCVGTSCSNSDEATCLDQFGTYYPTYSCGTFTCPNPGDNCQLPIVVTLPAQLNYTDANQTTCGRGNDYADTCLGYYDGGEDIIYRLVVTEPICATFTATGNGSTNNWVGIAVDSACPPGATCIASANSSSGTVATISSLSLAAGTYTVMVDTFPSPTCLTSFTLTIVGCPRGACCLAGQGTLGCAVMYQTACATAGGVFGGNGSQCSGNDCNTNGVDDFCDILGGMADCNANGIPDVCEIAANPNLDADTNGILDSCQPDCNTNGVPDSCEVVGGCTVGICGTVYPAYCGRLADCQPNGIPDICELAKGRDVILTEGFEGGVVPPAGWTAVVNNPYTWQIDSYNPYEGVYNAQCLYDDALGMQDEWIISPQFALTGSATLSGYSEGSYYWGVTPYNNYDIEAWVIVGDLGGTDDILLGKIDDLTWLVNWTWTPFTFTFTAPGGPFRIGFRYHGSDGAEADIDAIVLEGQAGGGDCNHNGIPDDCDIRDDPTLDCNTNGVIDTCEWLDCNGNGRLDACDISGGTSSDCNNNGVPDECELAGHDCNTNGIPDDCDLVQNPEWDCNGNGIIDWCDINVYHTSQDCNSNGIPDECELYGKSRVVLQYDDGSSEDALGNASYEHEIYWIHHFTTANPGQIQGIQTCFGYFGSTTPGVNAGDTFYVYVWSDANGDGQPSDAVLLGMASGSVAAGSIATDVFQTVTLNVNVGTSFFIGASAHVLTGGYAAAMDTDVPAPGSQAWGGYKSVVPPAVFVPIDPNTFATDTTTFFNAATAGFPTNWMLRAQITFGAPPNDCNQNGIPDECDIQVAFGGFCPGTVYPPCDTDCDHNGKPDHCEKCGDLNNDGVVDQLDYWTMLDGFGRCGTDPRYLAAAAMDINHNGCIDLVDYQAWFCCYKTYAGKAFVPPPAPKPQPKLGKVPQAQPLPATPVGPAPKVR